MNVIMRAVAILVAGISVSGCVSMREAARGFAGVSTRVLEENKPQALSRVWKESPESTAPKIETILSEIGAYVYARDARQRLIAVYVSSTDTTPVGIFCEPAGEAATTILVSSPSRFAKEKIFSKIFIGLENPGAFAKKPEQAVVPAGAAR